MAKKILLVVFGAMSGFLIFGATGVLFIFCACYVSELFYGNRDWDVAYNEALIYSKSFGLLAAILGALIGVDQRYRWKEKEGTSSDQTQRAGEVLS
jgi:Mn2+/Fe2+ NRAMP family transporter